MTSSLRDETARLLLQHIPESTRGQAVQEATHALNDQSPYASFSLIVSLLQVQPSPQTQQILLDVLYARIEHGLPDDVVAICEAYPQLKSEVLVGSTKTIARAAALLRASPKRTCVPVTKLNILALPTDKDAIADEEIDHILEKAILHLQAIYKLLSNNALGAAVQDLLECCIVLVGAIDRSLASSAQQLMISLLAISPMVNESQQYLIWACIEELTASASSFYKSIGFTLWLRWITSAVRISPAVIGQPVYWECLIRGLRHGDSERRKSTLQVMRASIDVCVENSSLTHVIAGDCSSLSASDSIRTQYNRFCMVFETVVLGRYLNQVQECEADLDFLASSDCLVKPIWLYTLIASALDSNMPESNRRFIGAWALQSKLRVSDSGEYFQYLRDVFLPWATQGSLFTSSLRRGPQGELHCLHGENLSQYIVDSIHNNRTISNGVIDAVLDNILSKANNNFAYAMVHLIDGIGKAIDRDPTVTADVGLLEKANRVLTWTSMLPEVARDLILIRLWKMCHVVQQANPNLDFGQATKCAADMWTKALEKTRSLGVTPSVQTDGPISSISLQRSTREKNLQISIEKCSAFVVNLQERTDIAKMPDYFLNNLEDIWSDVEYLEYPKGLLMVLPKLLLNQHLMEASSEHDGLKERHSAMLRTLLHQAGTRSYLHYPLLKLLRQRVLLNSGKIVLDDLQELIIHLAENPACPTVDAQLEDATATLMVSVDPAFALYNYEFYFDRRESHGVAAFLDLLSRLGQENPTLIHGLFEHVLTCWKTQITPPPIVSIWKNVMQLQLMLLCLEQLIPGVGLSEARRILNDLQYVLSIEPLPKYRYLLEWMITRTYLHHCELQSTFFDELQTKDHQANPKFLSSLMKVGVNISKTEGSDQDFALRLAIAFVPLAASSKIVIRHEAQWQIPFLLDHCKDKGWRRVTEDRAVKELDAFVRGLDRFGDPPLERKLDKLDAIRDNHMTHLVEGPWFGLDKFERRQTNRDCFLTLYADDKNDEMPTLPISCLPLGMPASLPLERSGEAVINRISEVLQNTSDMNKILASDLGPTALQTKGNAYLEAARKRHDKLLVIASLVDNPYNLGGLSRVSEIFGAGALYVPNTKVTSNREFTGVSVSSHLHFPILPLAVPQLHLFLAEKKKNEGYTVVGIEQTDRSVTLGSSACVLPEKCLLVMGSEREGIPALILSECDILVEIPQIGITRSLNVQTAAGIVLCEYARQHSFRSN